MFLYKFLCGHKFSFLLDKTLEVRLLGNMVNVSLFHEKLLDYFPEWLYYFALPAAIMSIPVAPYPRQQMVLSGFKFLFLILTIIIGA